MSIFPEMAANILIRLWEVFLILEGESATSEERNWRYEELAWGSLEAIQATTEALSEGLLLDAWTLLAAMEDWEWTTRPRIPPRPPVNVGRRNHRAVRGVLERALAQMLAERYLLTAQWAAAVISALVQNKHGWERTSALHPHISSK